MRNYCYLLKWTYSAVDRDDFTSILLCQVANSQRTWKHLSYYLSTLFSSAYPCWLKPEAGGKRHVSKVGKEVKAKECGRDLVKGLADVGLSPSWLEVGSLAENNKQVHWAPKRSIQGVQMLWYQGRMLNSANLVKGEMKGEMKNKIQHLPTASLGRRSERLSHWCFPELFGNLAVLCLELNITAVIATLRCPRKKS